MGGKEAKQIKRQSLIKVVLIKKKKKKERKKTSSKGCTEWKAMSLTANYVVAPIKEQVNMTEH